MCCHVFKKCRTRKNLKEKYEVEKVYTDLDEMLNDSEIDCVYVASPNSLHFEQSLKALKAGKQ